MNVLPESARPATQSLPFHLECSRCQARYSAQSLQTYCRREGCNSPLLVRFDFSERRPGREVLRPRADMWRYRFFLPVLEEEHIVSLGEGFTPLLRLRNLERQLGLHRLYLKDEGLNPTGSFKARGLAMAVSRALELGVRSCVIPTAGNAGSALSAYCSRAGLEAHVFMPADAPAVFKAECRAFGARLTLVEGTIQDCARRMQAENSDGTRFDVSTLKEPYRVEGKKTMGYEIAEQLGWRTPDWVLYPTGGGTGLIGIWKAFQEMLELGWLPALQTRMVAVQSEGCAPIVEAWEKGLTEAAPWQQPRPTLASGLRVPNPFGHRLILQVLRQSQGRALAVSEAAIRSAIQTLAQKEGILPAPEGAATWAALLQLQDAALLQPEDTVLLLNTGSLYKYLDSGNGNLRLEGNTGK